MEPRQGPVVSIKARHAVMITRFLSVTSVFLAASLWSFAVSAEENSQCKADVVEQLQRQCNNSVPGYDVILSTYRGQCCGRPLRVLAPSTLQPWIGRQAILFEAQVSTPVNISYENPSLIPSLIDAQLAGWAQQDLWIVDGASLPSLAYRQALLALEQKVLDNPEVNWPDVQDLWANLTVAGGRTVAVPLSSDALLMYYRRDALTALGRDAPTTWDDLLDLASSWNSATATATAAAAAAAAAAGDADAGAAPPPQPQHALCLSAAPRCSSATWLLSAILASMTQLWGPRTGWALALEEPDPWVALQLLNSSAMARGLSTFRALLTAGPAGLTCEQPLELFAQGECLVTFGLGRAFAQLQQSASVSNASAAAQSNNSSVGGGGAGGSVSLVRGVVGVALPPGSTHVLDRGRSELVPASQQACRVPILSSGSSAAGGGAGAWACAAPMLSYGGTFSVVGRRNGAVYQDLAFQFAVWLASLEAQWQGVQVDGSGAAPAGVEPIREGMLDPAAAAQLAEYGYDLTDAQSYLAALQAAFTSPNVALEFGAPGAFTLRSLMGDAIQSYLGGAPAATVADTMLRGWVAEWQRLNFTVADVQQMLRAATPDPFAVPSQGDQSSGEKGVVGWAVAVGVMGALAVLALAGLALWCYRVGRGEARLRRIVPPGISPQTTLVVTDIQDSTKMWELLHSDVMDVAIYHHHSLARRLILRFRGYESATEGDSFIIAFHTADDAVCFCALFQQDLLYVPWPAELLALEGCRPVWMCKSEPEPKRRRDSQQSQQPLEVTRSGAPLSPLALQGPPSGLRLASTTQAAAAAAALQPLQFPMNAPVPAFAPLPTLGSQTDQPPDNTSVTLSMVARSGPQHSLSLGALVGAGGGDMVEISNATSGSGGDRFITTAGSPTAGFPELTTHGTFSGGTSASAQGGSGPQGAAAAEALNGGGGAPSGGAALLGPPPLGPGPAVPPRFARSTAPYVLMSPASSGVHTMGALGASPRQLSFLGRSLSRLAPASIPSGSTTAGGGVQPLSPTASFGGAAGGSAGGRALERHSTPRGNSGSRSRMVGSATSEAAAPAAVVAAAAAASHSAGDDILTTTPVSPVAFTNGTSLSGAASGGEAAATTTTTTTAAAAARAGFASGAVMSFRESFRGDCGRGAASVSDSDEGSLTRRVAASSNSSPPLPARRSRALDTSPETSNSGGAEHKAPTLTGYQTVSAVGTSRSGSLPGGADGSTGTNAAGSNGRAANLRAPGGVSRSHSGVRRSLSASGRSGAGGGSGGPSDGGGEVDSILSRSGGARTLRGHGRLSTTGSRSAARRSSADTLDVAPDRLTNNSRQSRSTEIATVSEFNVVLESGGQHFVNPRSETDVAPRQLSNSVGRGAKAPSNTGFSHMPAAAAPALLLTPQVVSPSAAAAGSAGARGCGVAAAGIGGGAAAAAVAGPSVGPLGEGSSTMDRSLVPTSAYSPRAAARRPSVTFDVQSSAGGGGGGSHSCDDGTSGSGGGGGVSDGAASGTAAPHVPAPSTSVSPRHGPHGAASVSSPQLDSGSTQDHPADPAVLEYPLQAAALAGPTLPHPASHTSQRQPALAYRRAPSHLGPSAGTALLSTPPPPFASRGASLRRRSDITPAAAAAVAAAAASFTDHASPYTTTFTYTMAAPPGGPGYGHGGGHVYDSGLRPSPLGRGVSQSSISGLPAVRPGMRGSGGGGTSDATGQRSSTSRSLRGPSVDGDETGDHGELSAAYGGVGQSSPLPTLFPAGALSDDDFASGSNSAAGTGGRPSATTAGESGLPSGAVPASPPFSSYIAAASAAAAAAVAPAGGGGGSARTSNVRRSMTDGSALQRQLQQLQHPRQRTSSLGARVASGPLAAAPSSPAVSIPRVAGYGGAAAGAPPTPPGQGSTGILPTVSMPAGSQTHGHGHGHGHGLSRSLLALVSMPSPRLVGGGGGGRLSSLGVGPAAVHPTAPESRAASMASMMRLASQHNLQSVGDSLCSRWRVVEEGEPGAQLVFRGLRVRMGAHSGLSEATDLAQLNRTANRMQYTGVGLSMAKAVADCAHGGQMLMSEAAFMQLAVESLREGVMVLHMGEHRLKDDLPNISLYCGCPRGLQGRLPTLRAVRSRQQFSLGVLDAPAGSVVVVFMHVVGAVSLLEWRPDLAATALAMFRDHVSLELIKYQGYLVEAVDGLVLASFSSPAAGLVWVAKCQSDMTMLPWPEELMCHEACEELCVTRMNPSTGVHEDVVVFRGLRLKAGVDMGRLRGEINCVTGRMSYRGRAMNRAARIVAAAGSGQILASSEVWLAAATQPAARLCGLTAASMGQFVLKGVAEPMEVYLVKTAAGVMSCRARTVLNRPEGPLELDELPISDPMAALQHHVNINNAGSSAAAAAAAASTAALARQVAAAAAAASPALRGGGGGSVAAAAAGGGVAGAGGASAAAVAAAAAAAAGGPSVTSRLMLGRMHSVSGGLAAALRREESMTKRPLSRNVSMRSSRRSSVGSQFSNLAANTMVAAARGSFDGRQDATSPLRAGAGAGAAPPAPGTGVIGSSVSGPAMIAAAPSLPAAVAAAGASMPGPAGGAAAGGGGIDGSAGQVVISVGAAGTQRSASQPQLMMPGSGMTPVGLIPAGGSVRVGGTGAGAIHTGASGVGLSTHPAASAAAVGSLHGAAAAGIYPAVAGFVPFMGPAGNGVGASMYGASGIMPYGLPSIGSGTRTSRTSRNSAGEQVDTTEGGHSSNPRSSNASNRSGHPLWGPRLTAGMQLHPSQPHAQVAGTGTAGGGGGGGSGAVAAAANSPVSSRSGPAQGIVRHISALIRSASMALHGGSSGHTSAAAAAAASAAATAAATVAAAGAAGGGGGGGGGGRSTSYQRMLLSSTRTGGGTDGTSGAAGSLADVGSGLVHSVDRGTAGDLHHRAGDIGTIRDSASGMVMMDTRLLSTGGLPGPAAGGGGPPPAIASAGVRAGSGGGGGGGGRERLPARIRAGGSLFRAGSFSGHLRRRAAEDTSRASDFGVTAAAAAAVRRSTRSPPEAGRRFVATATGLSYVATVVGGTAAGTQGHPPSPAVSPALRTALASGAGGTGSNAAGGGGGGYYWRRDVHGAAAAAAAAASSTGGSILSSARRGEPRGDGLLLDRYLPEGGNGFVIVVGEEDIEGESDGEEMEGESVDGGEAHEAAPASPPPPSIAAAAMQATLGGSEAGGRAPIVVGGGGGGGGGIGAGGGSLGSAGERQAQRGLSIAATLMHLNSGRLGGGGGGGGGGGASSSPVVLAPASGASVHL